MEATMTVDNLMEEKGVKRHALALIVIHLDI
jgi:hypothetical protein